MTEDKMVGQHHRLNGHEFERAPGVGDGPGGLACCSPWGHKESDTTEQLNNNHNMILGFPGGSVVKNSPANAGDAGPVSGQRRSAGGGNGNPLQCSYLRNSMDRGGLQASPWGHNRVGRNLANEHQKHDHAASNYSSPVDSAQFV